MPPLHARQDKLFDNPPPAIDDRRFSQLPMLRHHAASKLARRRAADTAREVVGQAMADALDGDPVADLPGRVADAVADAVVPAVLDVMEAGTRRAGLWCDECRTVNHTSECFACGERSQRLVVVFDPVEFTDLVAAADDQPVG